MFHTILVADGGLADGVAAGEQAAVAWQDLWQMPVDLGLLALGPLSEPSAQPRPLPFDDRAAAD